MKTDRKLKNHTQEMYNSIYLSIIGRGWSGWGGENRLLLGNEQIRKYLSKEFIPPDGKALELGCGEGNICRLLHKNNYEVTGIDISDVAIKWANQKNKIFNTNVKYICADLSSTEFKVTEKYDLIIDGNCFHCILGECRSIFLKNVNSLLKDDGLFIISSLCSKDNSDHYVVQNGKRYRFVRTCDNIQKEVEDENLKIIDKTVCEYENRKFNHINLFVKRKYIKVRSSLQLANRIL